MAIINLKDEADQVKKKRQAAQEKLRRMVKAYIDGVFPDEEYHHQKKLLETELEAQLKASYDAVINVPNLERFIEGIQDKLPNLDFEGKRLALDILGVIVWLDGQTIEVTGTSEPESQVLRCTHHPDVRTMMI